MHKITNPRAIANRVKLRRQAAQIKHLRRRLAELSGDAQPGVRTDPLLGIVRIKSR